LDGRKAIERLRLVSFSVGQDPIRNDIRGNEGGNGNAFVRGDMTQQGKRDLAEEVKNPLPTR